MSGADAGEPGGGAEAEAWLAASDGLVAGVHHALNNRLGTVSALVQLASMDGGPGPEAMGALREELERMGATLRLLGMIPRRPGEEPIPLRLSELLPDALALVAQHRDARDVRFAVETAPDLLPVLCAESALVHALLALLAGAAVAASEAGTARVDVRCTGDERRVTLEVEPEGDAVGGPVSGAGLAALFAAAGGDAETTETGIIARLPTLLAGRRGPHPAA
jgi:C4-dicarboxylate-specific signal transduction histidine kinase